MNTLHADWWQVLPLMFKAIVPGAQPDGATEAPRPDAGPADFSAAALAATGDWLVRLVDAYAPLLDRPEAFADALRAAAAEQRSALDRWRGLLMHAPTASQAVAPLFVAAGDGSGGAQGLLQTGLDRSFGGLADALGLRPSRRLQEAVSRLARAELDRHVALSDYLAEIGAALPDAVDRLLDQLAKRGQRGETVTEMLALLRLWARSLDESMHVALRSERGLAATARLVRASLVQRESLQRVVAIASQMLNLPTRDDVDAAYREIQSLKREVRAIRKRLPPQAAPVPRESPAPRARKAAARKEARR